MPHRPPAHQLHLVRGAQPWIVLGIFLIYPGFCQYGFPHRKLGKSKSAVGLTSMFFASFCVVVYLNFLHNFNYFHALFFGFIDIYHLCG